MFKFYKRKDFLKDKKRSFILIILLLIAIGEIGSRYSYAYFKKEIKLKNNLKLTMGNVCVNLDKNSKQNIDISGLNPGESKEDAIKIKNNGTLKARIKLNFFKENSNLDREFLSNFEYKILIKNNYNKSKEFKGNLYDLLSREELINIKDEHESYIILNSNEETTLYFTLCLNKNINYKYYNKTFDFSLDIISTQINNSI